MITPITPGYRQEQNRNQKHVLHYIPNLYSFPSNIMVLWYATKKDSFHKPPPPKSHCNGIIFVIPKNTAEKITVTKH